jgi:F-type H+-transporting ATPase subunit c
MTSIIAMAAGISMGLAALGIAIGQGIIGSKAMESIARQPEAAGNIRTTMIVALAIMETIGVLTFVIAIIMTGSL